MFDPGLPPTYVYDITTMGIRPKSSFTLSKCDHQRILKYVRAIKNGWLKVNKYGQSLNDNQRKHKKRWSRMLMDKNRLNSYISHHNFDIWMSNDLHFTNRQILRAPKARLPTNYESYNPPNEYLFTNVEKEKLLSLDVQQRNGRIIPIKHHSMRSISQYDRFIHERFERCLDLYLCPRKLRKKFMINPSHLLPKMPNVNELKPFPEQLSIEFIGHSQSVSCLDITMDGMWMCSGSYDGTVRVWEIDSGREYWRHSFGRGHKISAVKFNRNLNGLLTILCQHRCILIGLSWITNQLMFDQQITQPIVRLKKRMLDNKVSAMPIPQLNLNETLQLFNLDLFQELEHWPQLIQEMMNEMKIEVPQMFIKIANKIQEYNNKNIQTKNETKVNEIEKEEEDIGLNSNDISLAVRWSFLTLHSHKNNRIVSNYPLMNKNIICLSTLHSLSGVDWHSAGDYFATFTEENISSALIIHRFSNLRSQTVFSKSVGNIQQIRWHPKKPLLYIACKRIIYCLNLKSCKIVSRFTGPHSWITCFDVHSSGLNIIMGGMDGKVSWFDIDLSHAPYKTFNYHRTHCVRACAFHSHANYKHLWATAGDDGKVYIFYCRMFRDKFADPVLIPLKILSLKGNHRCLDIKWHSTQPWIFVACSDSIVRKYCPLS